MGAGPWGRNCLRTLGRAAGARLIAVASRNPATRALVAPECRVVAEWRELLDLELEGVVIATPPASHLPIAAEFLRRDIAVMIEKPLCMELAAAAEFRELAASRRAYAMVDHIHLYSPAYRMLKRLSPGLGAIRSVASAGGRQGPYRADTPALWDWGPHDVSMILDLMQAQPRSGSARRPLHVAAESGFADNYEIEMEFPGGARARATFGNALPRTRRLEVVHERGTLIYDNLAAAKLAYRGEGGAREREIVAALAAADLGRLPLDCALESFCDAVRSRSTDLASLDLAVAVTGVLDAVARATGEAGAAP